MSNKTMQGVQRGPLQGIDLERQSRTLTGQERQDRLTELAMTLRVWPGDTDGSNLTLGLIELCEEWLQPLGTMSMVEVGCFAGVSTEIFALFCKNVFAVDVWKPPPRSSEDDVEMVRWAERAFTKRLMGYPSVRVIKDFSTRAAERFRDGCLDAVYLDADHDEENERRDFAAWLPKLKPGGLFMGHDFSCAEPVLAEMGFGRDRIQTYQDASWVVKPI